MKEYEIIGDEVKISTPATEKTLGVVEVYDQDLRDIDLIDAEIAECDRRKEDALARRAARVERIADLEPIVAAIKLTEEEKEE